MLEERTCTLRFVAPSVGHEGLLRGTQQAVELVAMGKSEAELRREQRKKELEEKRKRLQAMKQRKKESVAAATPAAEERDDSLDKIKSMSSVDALLGALTSDIPPPAAPAPDIAEKKAGPEPSEAEP